MLKFHYGFGLLLGECDLQGRVKHTAGEGELRVTEAVSTAWCAEPWHFPTGLGGCRAMVSVHERACLAALNGANYLGLDPDIRLWRGLAFVRGCLSEKMEACGF